jgi:hypothetical protein
MTNRIPEQLELQLNCGSSVAPMNDIGAILLRHAAQVCGLAREDKLRRAFAPHAFDGSELHHEIDHELRGLENEVAAANIKRAVAAKYRNAIPTDAVIEIVAKLMEITWA